MQPVQTMQNQAYTPRDIDNRPGHELRWPASMIWRQGEPMVRTIGIADLKDAVRRGLDDFAAVPSHAAFLVFIYPVIGIVLSRLLFGYAMLPLVFPLAAGFALVGPVAAAGFYELARRRENNLDSSWWHFLDPLKGRSRLPLAVLTGMLAAIFGAWLAAAWAIYMNTLGTEAPATPAAFVSDLFGTGPGLTMIVVGNLVGAGFALLALAVSAFSFPMVVDKPVDPLKAILTSVAAFRKSPATMARWGITVALILLAGAIPLFIGLVIALPVLGYATWHLYTRAVAR